MTLAMHQESLRDRLAREHRERRVRIAEKAREHLARTQAKAEAEEPKRPEAEPASNPEPSVPAPPEFRPFGLPVPVLTKAAANLPVSISTRQAIRTIQHVVAQEYGVSREDILSPRRTANVVRPRQVAMYLAKTLTLRSLPEISRLFGDRDHTTVLHAVRRIEAIMTADDGFRGRVHEIKTIIEAIFAPTAANGATAEQT